MSNEDGTVWLTFNGEIYNFQQLRTELASRGHQFSSKTDSEVIIHAYEEWDLDCLKRFNGMFAFAIFDSARRRLLLARDHIGIKPLYFRHANGRLSFASEPKALLQLPDVKKEVHYPALFSFLQYGYVAGQASVWRGIQRLSPGSYLLLDLERGACSVESYWRLPSRRQALSLHDATDRLGELLGESVRSQLVADVPVGIFLSGGVDSSTVAAMASSMQSNVATFAIGFEGWDASEVQDARMMAEHCRTNHREAYVSRTRIAAMDAAFDIFDEPYGNNSIVPSYLVCEAARKHVKVALSGDGGDELFGGYLWYTRVEAKSRLREMKWRIQRLLRSIGLGTPWPNQCANRLEYYRFLRSPSFTVPQLCKLFPDVARDDLPDNEVELYERHWARDLPRYKRWQAIDLASFLPDDNLMRIDRCSMANSLEVRVPLLDHRIVEFAFELPDELCVGDGEQKVVLRNVLSPRQPEGLRGKRKQGFSCPIFEYISQEKMRRSISEGALVSNELIDRRALEDYVLEDRSPTSPLRLWYTYMLERWAARWLFG